MEVSFLNYTKIRTGFNKLRDKYTAQLGDVFKISDFHDEFLKDGVMPLELIEQKMDRWAAGVKH